MNKLYVFCGIPFSGKTTIAKKLAEKFGFVRIDLDNIKFDIFGTQTTDEEIDQQGWDKIYKRMYEVIEENLRSGKTVIQDTGNFTKHERGLVKKIANDLGIQAIEVFIDTPEEIARQRLVENRKKKKRFDVNLEDFSSAVMEMEPPDGPNTIIYNHPTKIDKWLAENFF